MESVLGLLILGLACLGLIDLIYTIIKFIKAKIFYNKFVKPFNKD